MDSLCQCRLEQATMGRVQESVCREDLSKSEELGREFAMALASVWPRCGHSGVKLTF